jgi:hypothetical protein
MKKKTSAITIGIDLGDRKHAVCVLDAKGDILKQETITNSRGSLTALSRRYPGALMVMEVGMHSPWASRFLKELGHRVLVANPRKVRTLKGVPETPGPPGPLPHCNPPRNLHDPKRKPKPTTGDARPARLPEEPGAVTPHTGICEEGVGQPASLPQSAKK